MDSPESGSATVELALLLPIVLILILAMAEIAVVGRAQLELINGAREGARVAAVNPEPADAVAAVQELLGDEARVAVTRPQVVGEPAVVRVTINHRLVPFLFGGSAVDLSAAASMRVER
ncbi:MAG: hypothetical protein HKN91_16795 [Acidimicrobiia bacterium]|nr:hypothetical protein [Acidimicrobiia bacterium]